MVDPDRPGIVWLKSSLSEAGNCVEAAWIADSQRWALRHSQSPAGPILTFTQEEWAAFVGGVRLGEFDGPSASV